MMTIYCHICEKTMTTCDCALNHVGFQGDREIEEVSHEFFNEERHNLEVEIDALEIAIDNALTVAEADALAAEVSTLKNQLKELL